MPAGMMAGLASYVAFTLARRAAFVLDRKSVHTLQGERIGIDHGHVLVARERIMQRLHPQPARRILLSASGQESGIRDGFRHARDHIEFGEMDPVSISRHDVFVPLTIPAILQCHDEGLAEGSAWPIPSRECVALCNDKLVFHNRMADGGFEQWLPPLAGSADLPSVLKKRVDEWGVNSHLLLCADDESRLAELVVDPDYFRQEYVTGATEYACHLLLLGGGRVACSMTVEYRFDSPEYIKGKSAGSGVSRVVPCRHLKPFSAMLASIGFEGLCCVNYKLRDGRPLVMEVNPRFGASLAPYLFCFVRRVASKVIDPTPATSGMDPAGAEEANETGSRNMSV